MICPKCLANNKNNATMCSSCGAQLSANSEISNNTNSVDDYNDAYVPHETVKNKIKPQQQYRTEEYGTTDYEGYENDKEDLQKTIRIQPMQENKKKEVTRSSAAAYINNGSKRKTHRVRRTVNTTATVIIWIIVLGIIGTGVYFGIKYGKQWVDELFGNAPIVDDNPTPPPIAQPNITVKNDENGIDYIVCTFYGNTGDTVYLRVGEKGTTQSYIFTDNIINTEIHLSELSELKLSEIESSSISVQLFAQYRISDGTMYDYNIEPIIINLPATPITLLSPTQPNTDVYTDTYPLVFAVEQGSTVYINDIPSNDKMDATGKVQYNVVISAGSTTTVNVKVKTPYHHTTEQIFTFTRKTPDLALTLTVNTTEAQNKIIKISGEKEEHTIITCNYVLSNYIDSGKTYSAEIRLPYYGKHRILLTEDSLDGSLTSTVERTVTSTPTLEMLSTNLIWAYNDEIVKHPESMTPHGYKLNSAEVMEYAISTDNLFLVNVAKEGEEPQLIYINNYVNNKTYTIGKKYTIFADFVGVYNGRPIMNAYYITV